MKKEELKFPPAGGRATRTEKKKKERCSDSKGGEKVGCRHPESWDDRDSRRESWGRTKKKKKRKRCYYYYYCCYWWWKSDCSDY